MLFTNLLKLSTNYSLLDINLFKLFFTDYVICPFYTKKRAKPTYIAMISTSCPSKKKKKKKSYSKKIVSAGDKVE